jgi:hypothetical protein
MDGRQKGHALRRQTHWDEKRDELEECQTRSARDSTTETSQQPVPGKRPAEGAMVPQTKLLPKRWTHDNCLFAQQKNDIGGCRKVTAKG